MRSIVRSLALLVCLGMSARAHDVAEQMAGVANRFIESLTPELKSKAVFAFNSDERQNWHFVPKVRAGITIKEMDEAQKLAAFTLLASGLSPEGMGKATNIISLESVLHVLEAGKGPVRDPGLYYFSVYGEPGGKKPWSWRVEGHHLSINFTIAGGAVAATPEFFGSNPAEVRDGPRQGLRILAAEEDEGFALLAALTAEQRRTAIWTDKSPNEIITGNQRQVSALETVGLPAAGMTPGQKAKLVGLVKVYVTRHRAELAADDLAVIEKAGWDKVHFGWAGSTNKGQRHYYRVQGPTFLLEFVNKDDANHIHTTWRDFARDFGADLLAEHYKQQPH